MRFLCAAALACLAWPALGQLTLPGTPAPKPQTPAKKPPQMPGQPAPQLPPELAEGPVIRATVNVVLVPTTVTDEKGRFVQGLEPQDFLLYDNDKLQTISRDIASLPLSLVVCIQRSSNVDSVLPKIRRIGNVLNDLLVGQDGEAAVIAFHHEIDLLQDFTRDPEELNQAVAKLKPGSRSSRLNDAVQTAIRMLRYKKDRRKVILLIAETLDRASEASVKEVATELQLHNVDVYTLNINRLVTRLQEKPDLPRPDPFPPGARPRPGVAPGDPTTQAQISGAPGYAAEFVPVVEEIFRAAKAIFVKNPAEVYTKFTGGREFGFTTQDGLERAVAAIGSEIRSQYILSYSPNNKMEGGFHRIRVEVTRPRLKVRTRPGYWMAAVPE